MYMSIFIFYYSTSLISAHNKQIELLHLFLCIMQNKQWLANASFFQFKCYLLADVPGAIRMIRSQEPRKNDVRPSFFTMDFTQSQVPVYDLPASCILHYCLLWVSILISKSLTIFLLLFTLSLQHLVVNLTHPRIHSPYRHSPI